MSTLIGRLPGYIDAETKHREFCRALSLIKQSALSSPVFEELIKEYDGRILKLKRIYLRVGGKEYQSPKGLSYTFGANFQTSVKMQIVSLEELSKQYEQESFWLKDASMRSFFLQMCIQHLSECQKLMLCIL